MKRLEEMASVVIVCNFGPSSSFITDPKLISRAKPLFGTHIAMAHYVVAPQGISE